MQNPEEKKSLKPVSTGWSEAQLLLTATYLICTARVIVNSEIPCTQLGIAAVDTEYGAPGAVDTFPVLPESKPAMLLLKSAGNMLQLLEAVVTANYAGKELEERHEILEGLAKMHYVIHQKAIEKGGK